MHVYIIVMTNHNSFLFIIELVSYMMRIDKKFVVKNFINLIILCCFNSEQILLLVVTIVFPALSEIDENPNNILYKL